MASALMCIACDVGDCARCYDTPAPAGVLGGNRCPCDHNEAGRNRRRLIVRGLFAVTPEPGDSELEGAMAEPELTCIRLRLTDEPGDVVLLNVDRGTTFTDEELGAVREFFLAVRERRRVSDITDGDSEGGED